MTKYTTSIYLNLHKMVWSLSTSISKVIHLEKLCLKDVWFHVNENGRQRTVEEEKKYVHAYVKAKFSRYQLENPTGINFQQPGWQNFPGPCALDWVEVTYNPYRAGFFHRKDNGQEVLSAQYCIMAHTNQVFCLGLTEGERNGYAENEQFVFDNGNRQITVLKRQKERANA